MTDAELGGAEQVTDAELEYRALYAEVSAINAEAYERYDAEHRALNEKHRALRRGA